MAPADSPSSRHAAIAATLRAEIQSGELAPGSTLASEAELSARFEVSRGTVRQALAALRAEGLITGGRGRQPVVTRPTLAQSFDEMISSRRGQSSSGGCQERACSSWHGGPRARRLQAISALNLSPTSCSTAVYGFSTARQR
jgi:DNA-binding GntR family transcriptional regulator